MRRTDLLDKLARLYSKRWSQRHGINPLNHLCDRATQIASYFWSHFQNAWVHFGYSTTAYHPQTDGQSERTIQTLEDMLRACAIDFRKVAFDLLRDALSAIFGLSELKVTEHLMARSGTDLKMAKLVVTDQTSSTSVLPQAFEIGESSHRIEHIEDKIEGLGNGRVIIQQDFDNLEAEFQKARAQIAKLQRKQLGNNNKISLARFRIANLEQIIEDI
ncbi:reverse transcriptase domain-containing protein [Tanacetum coccineum]